MITVYYDSGGCIQEISFLHIWQSFIFLFRGCNVWGGGSKWLQNYNYNYNWLQYYRGGGGGDLRSPNSDYVTCVRPPIAPVGDVHSKCIFVASVFLYLDMAFWKIISYYLHNCRSKSFKKIQLQLGLVWQRARNICKYIQQIWQIYVTTLAIRFILKLGMVWQKRYWVTEWQSRTIMRPETVTLESTSPKIDDTLKIYPRITFLYFFGYRNWMNWILNY